MTLVLLITEAAGLAEVHQARKRLGIPRMTVSDHGGGAGLGFRTAATASNAV